MGCSQAQRSCSVTEGVDVPLRGMPCKYDCGLVIEWWAIIPGCAKTIRILYDRPLDEDPAQQQLLRNERGLGSETGIEG